MDPNTILQESFTLKDLITSPAFLAIGGFLFYAIGGKSFSNYLVGRGVKKSLASPTKKWLFDNAKTKGTPYDWQAHVKDDLNSDEFKVARFTFPISLGVYAIGRTFMEIGNVLAVQDKIDSKIDSEIKKNKKDWRSIPVDLKA